MGRVELCTFIDCILLLIRIINPADGIFYHCRRWLDDKNKDGRKYHAEYRESHLLPSHESGSIEICMRKHFERHALEPISANQ
jgi:hypothetical protein